MSLIEENRICFEDNHLIVINKYPGEIVQGDSSDNIPLCESVKHYIKVKYNKPNNVFLGVTHRIDQPTSGLVIFAKTSKALGRINLMFKERSIRKIYLTLVHEVPKEDKKELRHFLWRNTKNNKTTAFREEAKDSKLAVLSYKIIKNSNRYSILEVLLETGRHHQIRSQMQAIGHPIKNDRKYGAKRIDSIFNGIYLHAHKLEFNHPITKKNINLSAPILWPVNEVEKLGLNIEGI